MRLLLVGIEPTKAFRAHLEANQCVLEVVKRAPSRRKTDETFEFVFFAPKTVDEIAQCKKLRASFPHSWIGVLVKEAWLAKTKGIPAFEEIGHADSLIGRETWEKVVALLLPQLAYQHHLQRQIAEMERQCDKLKHECEELGARSTQLINQFEKDVMLASNIQRSLLPKHTPAIPGIAVAAKYFPASGAGGDYYDIFEFGDKKRFGILLADSKTHGMAAALLTVLIKIRLEELKDRFPDSRSFVQYINREIQGVHKKELASLSLLYGILDRATLTFQYTVAGTLAPMLWRLGEAAPLSTAVNPAIGESNDFEFKESFIALKPSDLLLFYTDGLAAPLQASSGTPAALAELLQSLDPQSDPQHLQTEIMARVDRHRETTPLADDATIVQFFVGSRALYVASESK